MFILMKRRECGGKTVVPSPRAVSAARSVLIAHDGKGRGGGAILNSNKSRADNDLSSRSPHPRLIFKIFLYNIPALFLSLDAVDCGAPTPRDDADASTPFRREQRKL